MDSLNSNLRPSHPIHVVTNAYVSHLREARPEDPIESLHEFQLNALRCATHGVNGISPRFLFLHRQLIYVIHILAILRIVMLVVLIIIGLPSHLLRQLSKVGLNDTLDAWR